MSLRGAVQVRAAAAVAVVSPAKAEFGYIVRCTLCGRVALVCPGRKTTESSLLRPALPCPARLKTKAFLTVRREDQAGPRPRLRERNVFSKKVCKGMKRGKKIHSILARLLQM